MKRAILKISDDFMCQFLKGIQGTQTRCWNIIENPLPADAKIIRATNDDVNSTISFLIESETFPETKAGERYPELKSPVVEIVTLTEKTNNDAN